MSNKFLYDGWNLVAELNATNNALVRSYAWGLDLSGSMDDEGGGVGGLLWVNDASTLGSNSTHLVTFDGNGNVTALVDAGSGNETARYEYGPFGDVTQASGPMGRANPIRFSTKYSDDYTGLIYYGYRYYDPTTGRWLNRDPLGEEGGLNLYGFVENDPVSGVDALGLWNYWNPATWGVANGIGWSTADSFNPFHESASWNGYSADYFRQSLASATGFGIFGNYDECDQALTSTRMLGRSSTLALEIFGPLRLAQWAGSGAGLLRAGAALGLDGYGLYQSASAVGTGAGRLSAGDSWGAVELGLGLLGVKPGISGVMNSGSRFTSGVRGLANEAGFRAIGGRRMDPSTRLARDEIEHVRETFTELGGDVNKLRFNRGPHTGFDDDPGLFFIKGDILPIEGAVHPRSAMSIRAVLAHELGHEAHRGTTLARGAWNDEFRAGYWAVKNLNLPKHDQVHLIQDAIERAREANKRIKLNPLMQGVLNP